MFIRVHLRFQLLREMKLPIDQPLVLANPNAGAFRRWLKSDMCIMRWVFLALYVLILASLLVASLTDPSDSGPFFAMIIAVLAMFVAQAILIFGAGTVQLCRPVHRRRLLIPVTVASLMLTLLLFGFCLAMMELLRLDHINWPDWSAIAFWVFIGGSWIGWGVLLFAHVKYLPRYSVISRLASYLFAGSLAELLAAVPSHVIVSRRPGCMVGILTMLGIIAGISVMLFSFGPMIVLLFLRPRLRAERETDGTIFCPSCGYDLRASKDRCPECGLPFVVKT